MKRRFKIILCSVALALGMCFSTGNASGQALTHDPLNYIQSILQYIMDQIREGNFDIGEGLSKLEGMREQFQAQRDKIDQIIAIVEMYQQFSGAVSDIKAIAEISEAITKDIMRFKQYEYMFNEIGVFEAALSATNLVITYIKVTESLITEVKGDFFSIAKITQSDPLTMLSELRKEAEYLYAGYMYIRDEFYDAFRDAYYMSVSLKFKQADRDFFSMDFF